MTEITRREFDEAYERLARGIDEEEQRARRSTDLLDKRLTGLHQLLDTYADVIGNLGLAVRELQKARPRPRVSIFWAWYDLWVGAYYDRAKRIWYICPLPCVVIRIAGKRAGEGGAG